MFLPKKCSGEKVFRRSIFKKSLIAVKAILRYNKTKIKSKKNGYINKQRRKQWLHEGNNSSDGGNADNRK